MPQEDIAKLIEKEHNSEYPKEIKYIFTINPKAVLEKYGKKNFNSK